MNTEHIIQSVVCMLAIDGRIGAQEYRFVQQVQQRLGIPSKALNQALAQAQQGQGRVKLPDEPAEQQRVFKVLVHAALADGVVTPQERRMLDAVGAKIGLRRDLIEQIISFYARENRTSRQCQTPPPTVPSPAPQQPATQTCPKCGAEQALDRLDCLRCGIVFSRFQPDHPPESHEALPEQAEYSGYDDAGEAASQLEQLQSLSALLNHAGSVLLLMVILIAVGFWLSRAPELGGYRYLMMLALIVAAVAIMARFAILNVAGVVTRGEIVNKWMVQSRGRYGTRGHHQSYHLEYVFQPATADEMRRGKAAVSKSQADRYRIGAPVKVRYLPGVPWIHRLEVW